MREILVNRAYIKVTTFVENYKHEKMFTTHILMLNDYFELDLKRFVDYMQIHFATIEKVEILENDTRR